MDGITPLSFAIALAASAVISLVLLWLLSGLRRPSISMIARNNEPVSRTTSFLFDRENLIDQDGEPEELPGLAVGDITTWRDLRAWIGNRFGPLPETLDKLEDGETLDLPAIAPDDMASLALSRRRNAGRVEMSEAGSFGPLDQHRARYLATSLARYKAVLEGAPCAVRILDKDENTLWQNQGFDAHTDEDASDLIAAAKDANGTARVRIDGARKGQDRYFEVQLTDIGEILIVYTTDITQIVQAEAMRREFIQTLTKTFANLTTGLAVFDRHRQLALFNPALLDLTGLPAPFLSAQPPLMQFFDRLRDNKVLPEPKDYKSWRKQIEDMTSSASDGLYLEDWDLPNGTTYRVTGRPHPDGAVAFLFEDISDNVSLARRFRSQIILREAVLDASDQAKVVFGPDNIVTLCNLTCRALLGIDPDASFADMTLRDFLAVCDERLPQEVFWQRVEHAVLNRKDVNDLLQTHDGMSYLCRVRGLPGNSVIITLRGVDEFAELNAVVNA